MGGHRQRRRPAAADGPQGRSSAAVAPAPRRCCRLPGPPAHAGRRQDGAGRHRRLRDRRDPRRIRRGLDGRGTAPAARRQDPRAIREANGRRPRAGRSVSGREQVKEAIRELTEEYTAALREYLEKDGEAALLRAYQVGRGALREGLGVLEVAALHQEALVAALLAMLAPEESGQTARRASEFFGETLAPFEMTQRGVQEANSILRDMNRELEQRVRVVLRAYRATKDELDEQKRLEQLKNEFISV